MPSSFSKDWLVTQPGSSLHFILLISDCNELFMSLIKNDWGNEANLGRPRYLTHQQLNSDFEAYLMIPSKDKI